MIAPNADETYFIDASIPIYAAGEQSEHKNPCLKVLERIEGRELKAATDTEVIQEILHRFHRIEMNDAGIELSRSFLRTGLRILPVVKSDVEDAISLFEKYVERRLPPRDALHAAVMNNNGINKIITLDKHFGDVIKEVNTVEPTDFL